MKLLYATSIKYPSPLANRMQVTDMAHAFHKALGNNFVFGGRNVPPGSYAALLRIEGRKRSFLFAWRYITTLTRARITHVYCREKRLLFFMLLYSKLFPSLRSVRFYMEEHAAPEKAWWYRFILQQVSGVVCLSPIIERDIKGMAPRVATLVAPHGVTPEVFDIPVTKEEARIRFNLPEAFICTYVGSLSTMGGVQKGADVLLAALAQLAPETSIQLLFVGPGAQDARYLQEKARGMGLAGRVHSTERVSREEVAWYQKASDVLLLPLLPNEYTHMLPLKVFEYMLSKRPIIASDLPSLEGVLDETNALLVPPNDAGALARVLVEVQQRVPGEKVENAYRRALSHTWDARAALTITFMTV